MEFRDVKTNLRFFERIGHSLEEPHGLRGIFERRYPRTLVEQHLSAARMGPLPAKDLDHRFHIRNPGEWTTCYDNTWVEPPIYSRSIKIVELRKNFFGDKFIISRPLSSIELERRERPKNQTYIRTIDPAEVEKLIGRGYQICGESSITSWDPEGYGGFVYRVFEMQKTSKLG